MDASKDSGNGSKTPEKEEEKPAVKTPNKAAILAKNPLLGNMNIGGMKLSSYGFGGQKKASANLYGIPMGGMKLGTPKGASKPITPQKSPRDVTEKPDEEIKTPEVAKTSVTPRRPGSGK